MSEDYLFIYLFYMVNCCLMIYVFFSLYNLVYRYFLFERDTSLVIFFSYRYHLLSFEEQVKGFDGKR